MSHSPNYVIAVSSPSGGGKTTLVKKAAELLEGTTLFFDDYASVSEYPDDKNWAKAGADVNEWRTPRFSQELARQLVEAVESRPRAKDST